MNYYVINSLKVWTGEILSKPQSAGRRRNEIPADKAPFPTLAADEFARWNFGEWEVLSSYPTKTPPVPTTATKAQIRIALKRAGKLPALASYISSLGANSEERIMLEEESIIRRGGTISNLIKDGLSLTETQMDQLFTVANQIT